MMRRAALAGVLLLLLSAASVSAATTHTVDIVNFAFQQTPLKVKLGDSVNWHNTTTATTHTTTENKFLLWNMTVAHGATSSNVLFAQAGAFAYHCQIHPDMHGTVKVKMSASPTSGTTSTAFSIRAATINAASGFIHDIQKRKSGGTWTSWMSTTGQTVTFKAPSSGTWQFRARLRRTSDSLATGWSPALSVSVS